MPPIPGGMSPPRSVSLSLPPRLCFSLRSLLLCAKPSFPPANCIFANFLRHSREMTRVCSRNLTQRPAFGGDDNAFPTCGLRIKVRRFWWVTLSEHKWVILGERRGQFSISTIFHSQFKHLHAPTLTRVLS